MFFFSIINIMKVVQLYIQMLYARGSLGLMALVQYFRRICIISA